MPYGSGPASAVRKQSSNIETKSGETSMTTRNVKITLAALAVMTPTLALAEDGVSAGQFVANNVWMMVATALVFIMHLGFASVESGLTRAKNTTNILFKNVFVICSGLLTYYLVGFNLMYPGEAFAGAWFGFGGFGLATDAAGLGIGYADGQYTYWTCLLYTSPSPRDKRQSRMPSSA